MVVSGTCRSRVVGSFVDIGILFGNFSSMTFSTIVLISFLSSSSLAFSVESSKADFLLTHESQNRRNFQTRISKRILPLVFSDTEVEASENNFHIESSPSFVAIHDIQNRVHDPQHMFHPVELSHHCWKRRPVHFL